MNFKEFLLNENIEISIFFQILLESTGKTFDELKNKIPSLRNRYFYDLRKKEGKTGSFLQYVIWNEKDDYFRIVYHVVPTYSKQVKIISSTKTGKEYISDHYEVILEFQDTKEYLGSIKDFLKLSFKEQEKLFRRYVNETKIKVHSNSPDFLYQGAFENLDREGVSVYPFPSEVPKGKQIWASRHNGAGKLHLSKHLIEVLQTVHFLIFKILKLIKIEYGKSEPETPKEKQPIKSIPKQPEQETKIKKPKEEPSNQDVDLSTIAKVPAPTSTIHQEISKELAPYFNLVKNKKDWKLPIDTVIEADKETIQKVSDAIEYFAGSIPEIKKLEKGKYSVKAVGYYKSIGRF